MNKYDEAINLLQIEINRINYADQCDQAHSSQLHKKNCYKVALEALKQASERQNPQPLTLEQLKERVGKIVYINKKPYYVDLNDVEEIQIRSNANRSLTILKECNYGKTWFAYDHEWKGEN